MAASHVPQTGVVLASSRPTAEHIARGAGRHAQKTEQHRQVAVQASSLPSSSCDELLGSASLSPESLPADMQGALQTGELPLHVLRRYLDLQNTWLGPLSQIRGFRERLLADPNFHVKVGIEVGIGICTKSSAEFGKRGELFWVELDFVLANVIMALIADFMLVWLPAPTIAFRPTGDGSKNAVMSFFDSCPDNAFQRVPEGHAPYSIAQRGGAVARNGLKLLAVGFAASLLGVGITNVLVGFRQFLDPSFIPLNPPQDVLKTSAAYASYMALSSNLRYQVIAGVVEQRGFEVIFEKNPRIQNVLSFVTRTGNTFLGSWWWIDYVRLLGFQKITKGH
ncbi:hypothetical protein WJX84_001462 [Apatococcus fuscideae]|uniref:Uncharacterized protein n=1 Tax=Apatococcus fuscideae TaxID=2026836 RepID=A0AAW1SNM0_9CHLO